MAGQENGRGECCSRGETDFPGLLGNKRTRLPAGGCASDETKMKVLLAALAVEFVAFDARICAKFRGT